MIAKEEWLALAIRKFERNEEYEDCVAYLFDDNYTCDDVVTYITIGTEKAIVESVWTDGDDKVMLHISCKVLDGDVHMTSLTKRNQKRVLEMMAQHI